MRDGRGGISNTHCGYPTASWNTCSDRHGVTMVTMALLLSGRIRTLRAFPADGSITPSSIH
eukprot:6779229-Pyramimonas_sp.AAC.1